jgi:putative nucleotidyltransferase with HDIG domain
LKTALKSDNKPAAKKAELGKLVKTTQGLINQCVDEVYLKGLNPELVEECKKLAANVYDIFQRDKTVLQFLNELENKYPKELGHTFLTAIFASMIVSKIEWAEKLTSELIVQAAIVHDIGKLSLPNEIIAMKVSEMSEADLKIYKEHPQAGYDMLGKSKVSIQVRQIVKQHHEMINGEGYPDGLAAVNIHPLAKIICFCSDYAQHLEDNELSPRKGLETFVLDRENLAKYDQATIKLFIKAFIAQKK